MPSIADLGRLLILTGVVVVALGVILLLAGRLTFLGRLPGDIQIQSGGVSCLIPIATSILVSLVLTILLNIILALLQRR